MKKIDWKDKLELIGIFSILASLIFVVLQLKQEEDLLQLEMRNYSVDTSVAVNESIIENAEIWIRGNAGKELDPVDAAVYELLLTNFNDWHFQQSQIFKKIEPDAEDQVLAMYAGFLLENPGAYRVWIDREHKLNAYRKAVDPTETVTSDWIETINAAVETIREAKTE